MARAPKGQPAKGQPKNKHIVAATLATPVANIEKVQAEAGRLRPIHPTLTDDEVALVTLKISTRKSDRQISRELQCSHSWISTRMRKPEVQAFMAELAMATLGVAAARGLQTLADLALKSRDEGMRYKASTELLDRAGLGNTTAQRTTGGAGFSFTFAPPKAGQ